MFNNDEWAEIVSHPAAGLKNESISHRGYMASHIDLNFLEFKLFER